MVSGNPGKTLTIFDLPSIIRHAFLNVANPKNITSGFESAGLYSFTPIIFGDADFAPAYVADRPELSAGNFGEEDGILSVPASANNNVAVTITTEVGTNQNKMELGKESASDPSTSKRVQRPTILTTFSMEKRPFPKAAPRQFTTNRGIKRRKIGVLTDTSENEILENEEKLRVENRKDSVI